MDDLLDLDWSTNPTSQQQPSTISATNKSTPAQNNQPKDAFADLLNFSSSPAKSSTPQSLNQQRFQQQQQTTFQHLSTTSLSSTVATNSPKVAAHNNNGHPSTTTPMKSLQQQPLAPSPLIPSQPSPSSSSTSTLDDLLDPFAKSKPKSSGNVPLNTMRTQQTTGKIQELGGNGSHSQWNFDLLSAGSANSVSTTSDMVPTTSPSAETHQNSHIPLDPFDMDSLMHATQTSKQQEYSSATALHGDDDDINPLGLLAEPVSKVAAQQEVPFIPNNHSSKDDDEHTYQSSVASNHTSSPVYQHQNQQHDALLAQLVDMGFGVEESKVALEASGNVDLQSAIDLIVQQTEAMRQQKESTPEPLEAKQTDQEPSFQQHKERLVSQASELGGYFYKNASLFVKSGKQKIAKAVEDYREQQAQQQAQQRQGRPKWMTEEADQVDGDDTTTLEKFVDSDDDGPMAEDEERLMMQRMEDERRHVEALRQKQQKEQQRLRQQKPVFRSRLLDDDDDDQYVSPSRRRLQQQSSPQNQHQTPRPSSSSTSKTEPSPSVQQARPPSPPPSRPVIEASSDQLSSATTHRQKGNELYKLGQFGDAEEAYTKAIDILPTGHYHLILLSNNRAMTRLKTGHYKQCIEDCEVVLDLAGYVAASSGDVTSQDNITINGRDHIIKALHRKSEALEHMEKYEPALASYQELIKWEGHGNSKVNQAMVRCRKIVQGPPPSQAAPPPRRKTTSTASGNGKAVTAMRAQAALQEAEDAERLAKTDHVNDLLAKWKQGKEANLRALLATLDTLLWTDANWKPIQISELIQPKKCKINYLKAISKVHPDKLPSTVNVEQRMIASGIFSTLNEAWDSFKTENNL